MRITDYTRVVENLSGKHLYDDAPSNIVIMGILTFLLLLVFLANTEVEDKKIKIKDKFHYVWLVLMIFTIIGMFIPQKIIERSSILSDNYKYTISEEKANTVDKYGVIQTRENKVVITFDSDPLLPKELITYASEFDRVFDKPNDKNEFIVGTVGQEGITIVAKHLLSEDDSLVNQIRREYQDDNYVILTKEELGKDYDKIVEAMENVHRENYQNPYQVKYPNNE